MIQNLQHKPQKIAIVGSSGTGKSTYFSRFILNSSYSKKFIFDHQGEMAVRLGVQPILSVEQLDEYLKSEIDIICFDPALEFEGDLPTAFDFFCDFVFTFSKANPFDLKIFAVDEFQDCSSTDICNGYLAKVLETGRRYGLDWISVQQGLNCAHNRVRNQMTEIVCFRTKDDAPLKALPFTPPDDLLTLPDGSFYLYKNRTGELIKSQIQLGS